jgi:succinyl-diaminopimelate desuccinylase
MVTPGDRIDSSELIELTQALVRLPTVYDPARGLSEAPAADLIAETLRRWGWSPTVELVAPGRPNVFATVDGGQPGPHLLFEGHTDVVTEGDPADWKLDPFGGDLIDGRLYGRGAADMKGGLAAMLLATRAVAEAGPFPGRITVACLVDEEGMMSGAKHFVAHGHADGVDAAICCEPEAGEICPVSKGSLRLRVDGRGRMAHGAMPHHGDNPIPRLAALVVGLADLQRELQERVGEHPQLGLPYLTPTVLEAGTPAQMNVIPAGASLWIDVRTVPGIEHSEVVERIRALAGTTTAVTVIDDRPVVDTPSESDVVAALRAAHEAVTGEPARIGGVPGATDGTVLTSRAGIPSVVYGPGGKWIAHQANEFVEVDDLVAHAHVYADAAVRFLSAGA